MAQSDLFLGPHENTGAQAIRLNKRFHESHLVDDTHFQEETRESGKSFFAQIAAPIKIVPRAIARRNDSELLYYLPATLGVPPVLQYRSTAELLYAPSPRAEGTRLRGSLL